MKKSRVVSILVMMFFMLSCFSPAVTASPMNDLAGHWAEASISNMVDQGIISGYPDGTFRPEGKITRAEFASILVRGFELPTGGSKVFSDTADHWAKDFIAAAYSQGIISGYSATEFGPDDPITREQMAVMIVKAANLTNSDNAKSFADSGNIADWAKQAVAIASSNNLISGYAADNTFRPKGNTTRAEAAVVLNQSLSLKTPTDETPTPPEEDYRVIDKAGTYGPAAGSETVVGNVTVQSPDVTLRNLIIQGDLIIGKQVGDGDVTLNNVTVKGKTYIRGGGSDSIHINGGQYNEIIVEKTATGSVRIVAIDSSGLKVVISENADGEKIILEGNFKNVTIKAENVDIVTQGETSIDDFKVESGLDDVKIELSKGTIIDELNLNSTVNVKGEGTIKEASGSKAKESSYATEPDRITTPSAGGGGGSSSSTVEVSAITVSPTTMNLTVGGDPGTITATVQPSNATNKNVTWTSSNIAVATVVNGVVTPKTVGTTTIKATTVDGGFAKTISVTVTAAPVTDADKVATAKGNLDLGDLSGVISDLTLPTIQDDATVVWASNNTAVIANDGTVTRPAFTEGDATVTLTATITSGTASDTKEFAVTVIKAEETDAEKVAKAKANLSLGDISAIVENMTLPTTQDDATVSWASGTEGVIATDGTVVRPESGTGDATVILTATLTVGSETDTKSFTVTVKEKAATQHTLTLTGDNISSAPGAGLVDSNASVTITVTPVAGKQVATFTVGGADKKSELTAEGKYIFNITTDTEVVVTYEDIKVTEVILDQATLNLVVGGATGTLTATVNPSDAANKAVTWSSSKKAVATVADGVVTPLSAGSTTITVTTDDGGKTATCVVTVAAESFTLIYTAGTGGTITGTSSQTVSSGGDGTLVTATPDVGYSFVKWSDDLATAERTDTSVTANITVEAQFKINEYTVIFKDHDGTEIKTQTVEHGSNATAPTDPTREGYTFTGWDKAFTNVTGDLTVTAQYTKDIIPVTNIAGVPTNGTVGSEIDLTVASVAPSDATNKTIVWSVKDAGATEVTTSNLSTGKFIPSAAGTLQLRATITNGLAESSNYTQDFTITIATAGTQADSFTATLANVSATIDTEVTAAELEAGITNLPSDASTDAAAFTPNAKGDVTKDIVITFSDGSKKTVMVTVKVERIKITEVKATSSDFGPPVFGEKANTHANLPKFTISEGSPAYFNTNNTSNAYWMKKVGEEFEKYGSEPFTAGTYIFRSQVRIGGDDALKYKLASPLKVTVGEDVWLANGTPSVSDEYSYCMVLSPEYVITAPAYASTTALTKATVTVANGTNLDDAKAALDSTVGIKGTKDEIGIADIEWTIAGYDGAVAKDYTATGVLSLPAGWTGSAEDVTAMVTVEAYVDPAAGAKEEVAKITVDALGTITVGDAKTLLEKAQALVGTGYTVSVKTADGTNISAEGIAKKAGKGTISFTVVKSDESANTADTETLNITVKAAALGGTVSIGGTLKFGEKLTANVESLTGNSDTSTLTYTWKRESETIGANQATYTTVEADIGEIIKVEITSSVETGTIIGTASSTIEKADGLPAPLVESFITGAPENMIMLKNDGTNFTIKVGTNKTGLQYSTNDGAKWDDLNASGEEIIISGTSILIRVKETATHNPGEAAKIILTDGYVFNRNTGTIINYVGEATEITIPSSITIDGVDVNVTKIDRDAFRAKELTSVTMPNTLKWIDTYAFENNLLESIVIPDSVEYLGTQAFEKNKLIKVTIPNSVTVIGPQAFMYNGPNKDSEDIPKTDYVGTWRLVGDSTVWVKDFVEGKGTSEDPYKVSSAEELNNVRYYLNDTTVYFKQTADIDLADYLASDGAGYNDGKGWEPIGTVGKAFGGKYDGSGKTISGLTINRDSDYQGLFGYIGNAVTLENISLIGVNIKGGKYVGGLVGFVVNGTIENCNVTGEVTGSNSDPYAGVGGLVGYNYGAIKKCYSTCSVSGHYNVGGLIGYNFITGSVKDSYATGSVKGDNYLGGLVGKNINSVENSYAFGAVSAGDNTGGLVGINSALAGGKTYTGTITSSYYDSATTGQSDTDKGEGKTTADMQTATPFTGWDTSIWKFEADSYPTLR